MRIKSLWAENWKSFAGRQEIPLSDITLAEASESAQGQKEIYFHEKTGAKIRSRFAKILPAVDTGRARGSRPAPALVRGFPDGGRRLAVVVGRVVRLDARPRSMPPAAAREESLRA